MKTLFDPVASEAAKTEGMTLAADNKAGLLALARDIAKRAALAKSSRTASADDVTEAFVAQGIPAGALGNAAGSIFTEECWEFTGLRIKSKRVCNHAREIKVWRLK